MIHAKKIHLPICARGERLSSSRSRPRDTRTHPEGHEEDVLLRLGIRLGRLGLQDLARPAVRSEQSHEGVHVGDVDGDGDDERRPEPGERGAAAARPAVELVDVDKVKLRGGDLSAHEPLRRGPYRRALTLWSGTTSRFHFADDEQHISPAASRLTGGRSADLGTRL